MWAAWQQQSADGSYGAVYTSFDACAACVSQAIAIGSFLGVRASAAQRFLLPRSRPHVRSQIVMLDFWDDERMASAAIPEPIT